MNIFWKTWQEKVKLLVDMKDGTYAERVVTAPLGVGDLTTDAWGVQKVSTPRSILHGLWTFDIPLNMWFMFENGVQVYTSALIASVGGAGTLTTSAAKTTVLLESRECPRYQPNRGHLFSTALFTPGKTKNGVREWGLQTIENGVFFRLKADGILYAVRKSGGVEKQENPVDVSGIPDFDIEKGHIYDIQFQWRGLGNYKFFVDNVLVYTMSLLGTLTELSMENPALPASFKCVRLGADDVGMSIGCVDITSENGQTDTEQYVSAYTENITSTTDTPIIAILNPLQIGGKTNTRTVTLARISFTCSKKAVLKVWSTRNPAALTGATFAELGGGSHLQTDSPLSAVGAVKATSVNTALMRLVTSVPVEVAVTRLVDNPYRDRIEFPLVRGDYLVVTSTSASGANDVVIELGEQI